jgi:Mg/Co/Ni transporter MgtE
LDTDIAPLLPEATLSEVSSYLASYNLLAVPIVDSNERLLGVVTVDDVLDLLLPENWRHFESLKKESEINYLWPIRKLIRTHWSFHERHVEALNHLMILKYLAVGLNDLPDFLVQLDF